MRKETTIDIPADHPAFAGHFPGASIVPGVVLLDEVLFAIESAGGPLPRTLRISSAKFFHPVGPGATLVIRHERLANGSILFEVMDGARKAAGGSLLLLDAPGPAAGALP